MTLYRCCKLARRASLLTTALMLLVAAGQGVARDFQYQGVVTQGAVATSDNNYYGDSDDGVSLELTEVSLNFFAELSSNWRFSGQGIYRRAGDVYDDTDIDYLFLDGSFATNESGQLGVRLGRFKNPLGFYNETRDIAFTRPAVFVPESVYTQQFRELLLSTDGAEFYGSLFSDNGEWTIQVGAGEPRVDGDDLEFLDRYESDISDRESLVGRIMYEHDGGQWKLAASGLDLNFDTSLSGTATIPNPPGPPLMIPFFDDQGDFENRRWILSGQYNWKDWQLTGEYNISDFKIMQTAAPSFEFTNEGYYLTLQKQLSPDWSVFYRWERFYADKDDKNGSRFVGTPIPTHSAFRKESVIGARWDINRNWLLLLDYHYIDGTALQSSRDNPVETDAKRHWHLLAATLSVRF